MIYIYRCKDHLVATEMANYLIDLGINAANMEYTKGIPSVRVCSELMVDVHIVEKFNASESVIDVNNNLYSWASEMLHRGEQIDVEIDKDNSKKGCFMIGVINRLLGILLAIFIVWPLLVLSTTLIYIVKGKETAVNYFGYVDSLIDNAINKINKNKDSK